MKPVKAPESSETDVKPVKPVKPAGAVSMFGGVDLFGAGQSPSVGVKSKPQGISTINRSQFYVRWNF